jgi:hypothetical protein
MFNLHWVERQQCDKERGTHPQWFRSSLLALSLRAILGSPSWEQRARWLRVILPVFQLWLLDIGLWPSEYKALSKFFVPFSTRRASWVSLQASCPSPSWHITFCLFPPKLATWFFQSLALLDLVLSGPRSSTVRRWPELVESKSFLLPYEDIHHRIGCRLTGSSNTC